MDDKKEKLAVRILRDLDNVFNSPCEENAVRVIEDLSSTGLLNISHYIIKYYRDIFEYSANLQLKEIVNYEILSDAYTSEINSIKMALEKGITTEDDKKDSKQVQEIYKNLDRTITQLEIKRRVIKKQNYLNCGKLLDKRLDETVSSILTKIQSSCIEYIKDDYLYYNREKVEKLNEQIKNALIPFITVTITSCKRLELFIQTVNSFINCCTDLHLITEWICVDDNSSDEDRERMKELYPFMTFIFKGIEDKGHPRSMNIIKKSVKSPYVFHMEDDFKFVKEQNYLSNCLEILNENDKIGQCLINKNYAETAANIDCLGGEFRITRQNGIRYYIHEHVTTEEEKEKWTKKHGSNGTHCNYWPHFSFRPSLLRKSVFDKLGEFNENVQHFEMEYSGRYIKEGFISVFLEGIYCLHIGRLTSERNDETKLNAYDLNLEQQFNKKIKIKNVYVNLDRRPDRAREFEQKAKEANVIVSRFSAVDGKTLANSTQLQQIFENNDYNMRKGMVGCALSHIKLYIELISSEYEAYTIFEDDIDFAPNFNKKLLNLIASSPDDWDVIYLGHHPRNKQNDNNQIETENKQVSLIRKNASESLGFSLGGTFGYIISKNGARKLLEFINTTGMTNGIDTVQQKSADTLAVYYCEPQLVYSECYRGNNSVDTDIQFDYDNELSMTISQRLDKELDFYKMIEEKSSFDEVSKLTASNTVDSDFYHKNTVEKIKELTENCKKNNIPHYTIGNEIIFVNKEYLARYYHRFMVGKPETDKYDISGVAPPRDA